MGIRCSYCKSQQILPDGEKDIWELTVDIRTGRISFKCFFCKLSFVVGIDERGRVSGIDLSEYEDGDFTCSKCGSGMKGLFFDHQSILLDVNEGCLKFWCPVCRENFPITITDKGHVKGVKD